jgi:hypothetical protein
MNWQRTMEITLANGRSAALLWICVAGDRVSVKKNNGTSVLTGEDLTN